MRQHSLKHFTCAGGKLVMKLVFVGATVAICMTGGAGVGTAMEIGELFIMGCWCWGMTVAMAMARAGRLGTGGEGNWLRISTFIAGRPLWNEGHIWCNSLTKLHIKCNFNLHYRAAAAMHTFVTTFSEQEERTFIWTDITRRLKPFFHARL